MNKKIWAIVVLVIIAIALAGGAIYLRQKISQPKPQACTQEAKLCPDGSYVGRTGSNCEFAACPEVKLNETANWKTYTNTEYGFEFKYPSEYGISGKIKQSGYYTYQVLQIASAYSLNKEYIDRSEFNILSGNSDYDLKNCLKDPMSYDFRVGLTKDIVNTKEINGSKFYVAVEKAGDSSMGGGRGVVSYYHILHNNYCYIILLNVYYRQVGYAGSDATKGEIDGQTTAVQKNEEILNQILSTFKFIK